MKKILPFVLSLVAFTHAGAQISVSSVIPSSIPAGTSVDADVKINKGNIGNFAKYQMDVPPGYVVSSVDAKSGNFTFENQRAKIVWVSVPSDPEFTVKFKIQGSTSATNQGSIIQKFFYLENNEKKEVEGPTVVLGGGSSDVTSGNVTSTTSSSSGSSGSSTSSVPVETVASSASGTDTKPVTDTKSPDTNTGSSTVTNTNSNNNTTTSSSSTPTVAIQTVKVETVPVVETVKTPANNTTASSTTSVAKTSASAPASAEGMSYRVQLGAFSAQPSKGKFAAAGNVSIDMIDGLYKVTTGNFKSKEEAMKRRDELQGKGLQGFVVTYKNGQRVK